MPRGFWKTPEGEEAYKNIEKPYDNSIMDNAYENYLKKTKNSDPKNDTKKIYLKMVRVKIADGREYIVYDQMDTRKDKIGNYPTFYRSPLGIHPHPIPNYEMMKEQDPDEEEGTFMNVKKMTGYSKIETRYDIPFQRRRQMKCMSFVMMLRCQG